ncbi:hypothetical protein BGZ94_002123 [Podila epigama]|nr:hypothetical protein BGZ94_002123 [Podila epigama]
MVKSTTSSPYRFVSGQSTKQSALSHPGSKYILTVRQQPKRAKVCGIKERDRRPIDPPPIVQIKLADAASDRHSDYLQSPYLFMCCNLVSASDPEGDIIAPAHRALAGTVVSSLNRLKDVDNSDGGFFVFGDMSVRIEGHFCLRFTLFEFVEGQVVQVMSALSSPLTVYSSKTFPGMAESTFLSRCFSDQGVRIRIRKDHHVKPKRALSIEKREPSTSESAAVQMYSPPSSSHEADHSDHELAMPILGAAMAGMASVATHQLSKRKSSGQSLRPSPGTESPSNASRSISTFHPYPPTKHVAACRSVPAPMAYYGSSESHDHTPPSSPPPPMRDVVREEYCRRSSDDDTIMMPRHVINF